jgi:hypothetical protein
VAIEWPTDGGQLAPDRPATLAGYAYDPEDGPLADEALRWESDRQGALGSGRHLLVEALSPGTHQITLTATDSDGMTAQATIHVFVGTRLFLPLIWR